MKKNIFTLFAIVLINILSHNSNAQKYFQTPITNPFGITDIGVSSAPAFVDIDFDGDMDLFAGSSAGYFYYFENIGNANAPQFKVAVQNPFNLTRLSGASSPDFYDLDGDGDLDMISGHSNGEFYYYKNKGTKQVPSFELPLKSAFGLPVLPTGLTRPKFIDINNDTIIDIMAGNVDGSIYYFKNIGNVNSPNFTTVVVNPMNISDVGSNSAPAFMDWDLDGDKDLFVGKLNGNTVCFKNIGNDTSANFSVIGTNLFGITNVGDYAILSPVDIDADGDLDLFIGNYAGNIIYYNNGVSYSNITTKVCDDTNYISPSGKYTWTQSGVYKDTITNYVGCDSIMTIHLSFGVPSYLSISVALCTNGSYISPSRKYTWNEAGEYTDTIPNATGCDSIFLITLYNDITLECGMLLHYNFENNADDLSVNGNNGTPNHITYVANSCQTDSSAAYFNGAQFSAISVGSKVKPSDFPVAFCFWINTPDVMTDQSIFRSDAWGGSSNYAGFNVRLSNGQLHVSYGDNSGAGIGARRTYSTDGNVLSPNKWYFVVINIYGKSDFKVYIDKVLVNGTYEGSANNIVHNTFTTGVIGIGMSNQYAYTGTLDEFRVYNRAINFSEIETLFSQGCSTSTSIEAMNSYHNIIFYPNPAKDIVYFKTNIQKVTIYNLAGNKILEEICTTSLNVSSLPQGIYIAETVLISGKIIRNKLIIE